VFYYCSSGDIVLKIFTPEYKQCQAYSVNLKKSCVVFMITTVHLYVFLVSQLSIICFVIVMKGFDYK